MLTFALVLYAAIGYGVYSAAFRDFKWQGAFLLGLLWPLLLGEAIYSAGE